MSQRKDNRFASASRPRSFTTHFGSSPSVLSSVLGGQYNSYYNGYSKPFSPSSYRNYSPYSSSLGRATSNLGIYGGTSSGYGGVYVAGQSLNSLNLMSPNLKNLDKRIVASQKNFKKEPFAAASSPQPQPKAQSHAGGSKERKSRAPARSHSFNKERSRSLTSLDNGGLSSRSVSLTSLASDGYCSGSERTSDAGDATRDTARDAPRDSNPSEPEPDYRALWEASQKEVTRLRDLLSTSERQLRESRGTVARLTQVNQNSLTELEKREKRAMERKLSEMEEELKQLQKLKAENERLRAENRALTRVVSKLTNSAGK